MILYGAGGHGKVVAEILQANKELEIKFWDDALKPDILGIEVQKPILNNAVRDREMIITVGVNIVRKSIAERLSPYFIFRNAIHPSSVISRWSLIAEGSIVMAQASINCDAVIGKHVILNTNCSVDHDCILEDYVHISPNVALAGNITVGEGAHIGIGACIIQGIKIGKWAIIGAGTVVIADVPDFAVVVGNPGKIIKYNIAP